MILSALRRRAPLISAFTLLVYLLPLLPLNTAWAQSSEEAHTPATGPSAQGEFSDATKAALEAHFVAQAGLSETPAAGNGSGANQPTVGPQGPPGTAPSPQAAPPAPIPGAAQSPSDTTQATQAVSPQAISLPSGASTMAGMGESFTAQLTTGVAAFNVPFRVPAGRGGVAPALGLVYASSNGYGLAGVGWSLAGPLAIARQSDRGLPGYDDRGDWHPEQDRFSFGGQELVPICTVSGGQCTGALAQEEFPLWSDGWQYFRARVEGAFLRFFWSPDHRTWRIQSKAGTSFELGVPLDGSGYEGGLERNPDAPREIYRWHIVRQYDAHGVPDAVTPAPNNLILFRYFHDQGLAYLSDLFYTPPASAPGTLDLSRFAHHVAFTYDSRPDRSISYRSGWMLEQRLRLTRVDVTSKPFTDAMAARELVRRYHLEYDPTTHASLLASVAVEGRCASAVLEESDQLLPPTSCALLPPLSFEYQRVTGSGAPLLDSQGFELERLATILREIDASPPHSLGSKSSLSDLIDVDSDGLADVVATQSALLGGQHQVFFNQGELSGRLSFAPASSMSVAGIAGVDASVLNLGSSNVAVLDLDGDARADLVHMPMQRRYSIFRSEQQGDQWLWQGRRITTASGQDVKIDFARDARRSAVMDVNGDGLVDLVFASATEYQTFFSLGRYPAGDGQFGQARWTGPSSAELINEPVTACVPWSAEPVRLGDPDVRVGDLNGDGLPDLVRFRSGQVFYWPGRGDGSWGIGDRTDCDAGDLAQERHIRMDNAARFGTAQAGTVQLGDVNGDGLADVVEIRADAVDVYLNDNGLAFTDRHTLTDVPFRSNLESPVRLTDINGSGSVDLLWGQGHEYRYIDLTGGVRPYLLSQVHNGLGKSTQLEYRSSVDLMVEADEAGQPWASVMPLSTPVVVRATVHDNLQAVGRAAGRYVTEYSYRDPVFEGRQREFRGFRTAETRQLGDLSSPTSIVRSTHLLGECEVAQSGFDVCSPANRWQDNWREPLKGLPVLTETFDEAGVYLASQHTSYELRQLYTGRDGRRVSVSFPTRQDAFRYDTSTFDGSSADVSLPALDVDLDGITQSEPRLVSRRATAGTAHLRSTSAYDDFGNVASATAFGCIAGCPEVDEAITAHRTTARVAGDTSGWLWRPTENFVTGSLQTAQRQRVRHEYNARGDLQRSLATLSGTLPLDRFHESAAAVAPAPPNASGGTAAPVEIQVAAYTHDAFGNVIETRAPHGRCSSVQLDSGYAELPVQETIYGGNVGTNGCGERAFVTQATYDRGLSLVLASTSITGQPAQFGYDGFGRLVAETYANPQQPGLLAALPSVTYQYLLPSDWRATPYSILVVRSQDGATPNHNAYHESYGYTDGLGRTLVTLSEADPSAGDGGAYVAGGVTHYTAKGQPIRAFENRFWSGDPLAFPLGEAPPLRYTSQLYDAFGRATQTYGLDGEVALASVHHALGMDRWDAADLETGGDHEGSFASVRADGHGRQVEAIERVRVNGVLEQRRLLSEYLPTGELRRIIQRRAGSSDVVRWLRYDSLGRLVLNVEPNTSVGFTPDPSTDPATLQAWRYAYNDAGDLVGTSDARGCGVNYHYDGAGRLLAEDYSPCLDHHSAYSTPNFTAQTGIEALYRYDIADPESSTIEDAAVRTLAINPNLLWGRLASASDLGSKRVMQYDAKGRATGTAVRVVTPGPPDNALANRYAPRWYIRQSLLDAASRPLETSTGASSPELLGAGGSSVVQSGYSARGVLIHTISSYGTLLASRSVDANGLATAMTFGDAAQTQRAFTYDDRLRLESVQTFRGTPQIWSSPPSGYTPPGGPEPTDQLSLEDYDFEYDLADNITKITDHRIPSEWPQSAKPVNREFEYDDSYRLIKATYDYGGGTDTWSSPFAAENASRSSVAEEPEPSPHVDFSQRVLEQEYEYDHLGNTQQTTDNADGFFDRSLGAISHGSTSAGPHQLQAASNRALAPTSPRQGDLDADYDDAGNLTELIVRRDGTCLPAGASCWQRYHYEWDELGYLSRARRWDLSAATPNERDDHGDVSDPLPSRAADVELRYTYAAGGDRVLKTAVDSANNQRHTVYIFGSLELRRTTFDSVDYVLSATTENVLLSGGVSARVVYSEEDLPALMSGGRHVFLMLSDQLGSNTFIIDYQTGELVEYATYQAYGSTESNYRPERWGSFREAYKFTGKEEDVEVGLAYFGARYLSLGLGRWMSPDAVTIHELGSDTNPYAYVHGRPLIAVDPDGNLAFLAVLGIAVAVSAAVNIGTQANQVGWSNINWGGVATAAFAGGVGAAVGGPVGSWAAGALGSSLLGAAIGSGAGAAASYTAGVGANNGLAALGVSGLQPQSMSWSGLGMAVGTGVLTGGIAYSTGSALANSKLGQALTDGLKKALGPTWGSGVAAGLFSSGGALAAGGSLAAATGGDFESAMIAAAGAGVGAGVATSLMTNPRTDPTGGRLSGREARAEVPRGAGTGTHRLGTARAWRSGAEPYSKWTQTSGDGTKAIQNTVYDADGNAVGHVDFKQHGSAPPGHGHRFPPGSPGSGHGPGAQHIPPDRVPPGWADLPSGVRPAQPVGVDRK